MDSKKMKSIKKMQDFYAQVPNAPIIQAEFGGLNFFTFDKWKEEGYINDDTDFFSLFRYDDYAKYNLGRLDWDVAPLAPFFESKVLESNDEYEIIQDNVGRKLKCFKGRRRGFMPQYVEHQVKDERSWEENVKWRLDPAAPSRFVSLEHDIQCMTAHSKEGTKIIANMVGGYMYLRSLIGPEDLLYMFYDDPKLIHSCMEAWLHITDSICAVHQKYVTIDEIFMGEDICYNCSSLISHDMIREFLFPYYQQLISNVKSRQLDKSRRLNIQIDTDGKSTTVIDLYKEIGMNYMSPFEVASGCDVVEIRKKYPDLLIGGGIDKRILAAGKDAIDRELDRIMPFMKSKGGYIPTCDHGVPEEVEFEDYMYYRERMLEYAE